MTRPELAARIAVLREAIASLEEQAAYDGAGVFGCLRTMQITLMILEHDLRLHDLGLPVEAVGAR